MVKNGQIQPSNLDKPMNPRDAFYGGRTEMVKIYHKVGEDEIIMYYDVRSLYPTVMKYHNALWGVCLVIDRTVWPSQDDLNVKRMPTSYSWREVRNNYLKLKKKEGLQKCWNWQILPGYNFKNNQYQILNQRDRQKSNIEASHHIRINT